MTDTIGVYNGPGGYTVPNVTVNVQCTVSVTKGDVQNSTILGGVDFIAPEHGIDPAPKTGGIG